MAPIRALVQRLDPDEGKPYSMAFVNVDWVVFRPQGLEDMRPVSMGEMVLGLRLFTTTPSEVLNTLTGECQLISRCGSH